MYLHPERNKNRVGRGKDKYEVFSETDMPWFILFHILKIRKDVENTMICRQEKNKKVVTRLLPLFLIFVPLIYDAVNI